MGFHRLILPDGRWIALEFHGLNQVGEGALKDRVNRHYFSMFAAVGAVGAISGLTLRNSNPYATGSEAFRAGAGGRTRPWRHTNLAAFLESFTHPHDPGGPSVADLVHFRCSSPPGPTRRTQMKTRLSIILTVIPLMIVLATTPAYSILGGITGALQRAQMIINQGIQIYEQQIAKLTMDGQLTELTSQFDHLKEQAMGAVGQLTQPFTDLSSSPAKFLGTGAVLEERVYRRGRGVRFVHRAARGNGNILHGFMAGADPEQSHCLRNRRAGALYGSASGDRSAGFAGLPCRAGSRRHAARFEPCHV